MKHTVVYKIKTKQPHLDECAVKPKTKECCRECSRMWWCGQRSRFVPKLFNHASLDENLLSQLEWVANGFPVGNSHRSIVRLAMSNVSPTFRIKEMDAIKGELSR